MIYDLLAALMIAVTTATTTGYIISRHTNNRLPPFFRSTKGPSADNEITKEPETPT